MSVLAFALGGVSLMGFPPSGAYLAKELLLGLVDWGAYLSVPPRSLSNPLALDALLKGIWPVLGGAVLTILLGRGRGGRAPLGDAMSAALGPARRATVALGGIFERTDGVLRLWPVAGLSLLALAIAFGAAMELGW